MDTSLDIESFSHWLTFPLYCFQADLIFVTSDLIESFSHWLVFAFNSSIKVEKDKKKYIEFLESLKRKQSECQMYCLDFLMKDKSWQSKAWELERRFPDRWAKKDMTLNENNEKVINFTYG